MNCPIFNKATKKLVQEISSNLKPAENYKEYYKTTYQCEKDDLWVVTELPRIKKK